MAFVKVEKAAGASAPRCLEESHDARRHGAHGMYQRGIAVGPEMRVLGRFRRFVRAGFTSSGHVS